MPSPPAVGLPATPSSARVPPRRRLALIVLATAQFMVVVDSSIVNVALPSIRAGLGLSPAEVSWVVDGYLTAFGGLLLLGGRLADVFRRREVFLAGLALFVLASAACGWAPDGVVLVAARVAQGVGGAVLAPAALSLLVNLFPAGEERRRAMGVWGGASGAGGIAGVLFGGLLSQSLGWPWIFWINLPIGVAVAAGALASVPTSPGRTGRFDVAGAATITLAMTALAFGLVSGGDAGWTVPQTWGALLVGAVAFAAFVLAERRAGEPLVPLGLVRRGPMVAADAMMAGIGAVSVGVFFFLPQFQQQVLGMSPLGTSLAQLPMAVTITVTSLLARRIAAVVGARRALRLGMASLVAGLGWLSTAGAGTGHALGLIGPFLLIGAGIGLGFVYVTTLAVAESAPGEAGLVSGLVNASRQMGGALGLAALVAVASIGTPAGGHAGPATDFRSAFLGAAALAALALLISLRRDHTPPTATDPGSR